jgi:probable blue pigment (indigoidine) exporter
MEGKWWWVTAVAPVAWGANYVVTRQLLPADHPIWGSALRAVPAAVVLLLLARTLPRGAWWWRAPLLGLVNIGAFFLLVYVASQALESGVAASVMALSPLALALAAWILLGRAPGVLVVVAGLLGLGGVCLVVGTDGSVVWSGVAASLGALALSSCGAVLTQRWRDGTPVLHLTAWQLVSGGVVLLLVALVAEGAPPPLGVVGTAGAAFSSLVATALAFVCWFAGSGTSRPARSASSACSTR